MINTSSGMTCLNDYMENNNYHPSIQLTILTSYLYLKNYETIEYVKYIHSNTIHANLDTVM